MSDLLESFRVAARDFSERIALVCEEEKFTYGELFGRVNILSDFLVKRGLLSGDHLAILLPNCAEYVVLMLAAARLRLVLVPMNPTLPLHALTRGLVRAKVDWIISGVGAWDTAGEAAVQSGLVVERVISVEELLPADLMASDEFAAYPSDNRYGVQDAIRVGQDIPYILTMTSGSTGDPKPILLGQNTKYERAKAAIRCYDIGPDDVVLVCTPLYHSLAERMVLLPLMIGARCVLLEHYSVQRWINAVGTHGVTFSVVVSAQAMQVTDALIKNRSTNTASLRRLVSSSSAMSKYAKSLLMEQLGADLHECYGTSEIAIATNLDCNAEQSKLASVGRPLPGVEVAILTEDGALAKAGERGEIICKTRCRFLGYFDAEDETYLAMHGDYVRTGDLGYLDEDGYLYFLDRIKDMVITGGINVFPNDVETVVEQFPGVKECASFAVPSGVLGEIVAVAVVMTEGELNRSLLRAHCAELLADYQQPQRYFQLTALPRNALGKVSRHDLASYCLNNGALLVS